MSDTTDPVFGDQHPYGPGSHAALDDPREMPSCYPIKGNVRHDGRHLYHRPDGADYKATKAEVWFDSPSAAEAAGFTLAPPHPADADVADFEPGGRSHPCAAGDVETNRSRVADLLAGGAAGVGLYSATTGSDDISGDAAITREVPSPADRATTTDGAPDTEGDDGGVSGKAAAAGAAGAAAIGAGAAALSRRGDDADDTIAGASGAAKDAITGGTSSAKDAITGGTSSAKDAITGKAAAGSAAAGAAIGGAAAKAGGAKDAATGKLAEAKETAAATAAATTGRVSSAAPGRDRLSTAAGTTVADDEPAWRRWLWPLLIGLGLLLLLGLLISRCGGDDEAVGTDEAAAPTATTADATVTDGEGTSATSEATATTADDTETTAEDTTADGTGGDIEALALAALADAGYDNITVNVDGDTVTLAGTVPTDADSQAAADAVAAIDGVTTVDNTLTVDTADAQTPGADAVNGEPDFTG